MRLSLLRHQRFAQRNVVCFGYLLFIVCAKDTSRNSPFGPILFKSRHFSKGSGLVYQLPHTLVFFLGELCSAACAVTSLPIRRRYRIDTRLCSHDLQARQRSTKRSIMKNTYTSSQIARLGNRPKQRRCFRPLYIFDALKVQESYARTEPYDPIPVILPRYQQFDLFAIQTQLKQTHLFCSDRILNQTQM